MISQWEIVIRLLLSAVLGGLVGLEREANNRPAGLKTHILVSMGSTLIMMISIDGFTSIGAGGDPARLAAQVVSGIGFLGAGTILRNGTNITGLTTAASLWVCGGIGLAVGSGYYLGALVTVMIVLFTLMKLGSIEKVLIKGKYRLLVIAGSERPGFIGDIGIALGRFNIDIVDIKILREIEDMKDGYIEIYFSLKVPHTFPNAQVLEEIIRIRSVEKAGWED